MRSACFCCCVVLLATAPARADDKTDAERHYQLGKRHYNVQEWNEAVDEFKAAYKLVPEAVYLFNIAQAYRLKRDCANAAKFYATYQREEKDRKARDSVKKLREEMEACAKTQPQPPPEKSEPDHKPPPDAKTDPPPGLNASGEPTNLTSTSTSQRETPPTPPVAPPTSSPGATEGGSGKRTVGLIVGGLGIVGVVTGVVFTFKGQSKASLASQCDLAPGDEDGVCNEADRTRFQADSDTAYRNAAIAYGVGGACVITGTVLVILSRKTKTPPTVSFTPLRGGAAITSLWRF